MKQILVDPFYLKNKDVHLNLDLKNEDLIYKLKTKINILKTQIKNNLKEFEHQNIHILYNLNSYWIWWEKNNTIIHNIFKGYNLKQYAIMNKYKIITKNEINHLLNQEDLNIQPKSKIKGNVKIKFKK